MLLRERPDREPQRPSAFALTLLFILLIRIVLVGVNAPVAMGSTTPLSLNSMAIGHTKRMPDCPHAGGIQVPDSRPMSAYTRQRVPTSASGSASAYANRRARFFDTSSDRLCARRTLYTTPPMTLH